MGNQVPSAASGTGLVALISGVYAYATVPAFTGIQGALASYMTGVVTATAFVVFALGGGAAGGAGGALLGGILGSAAGYVNGRKTGQAIGVEKGILEAIYKSAQLPEDVSVEEKQRVFSETFEKTKEKIESQTIRNTTSNYAKDWSAKGAIAGAIGGAVISGLFGINAGYTTAKDILLEEMEPKEKVTSAVPAAQREPVNTDVFVAPARQP